MTRKEQAEHERQEFLNKMIVDRYEALVRDLGHILTETGRDMDRVRETLKSSGEGLRDTTIEEHAALFAPSLDTIQKIKSLKVQIQTHRELMREFGISLPRKS